MYLKSSKVVTILNRIIMTPFLHSLQATGDPTKPVLWGEAQENKAATHFEGAWLLCMHYSAHFT